MSKQKSKRNRHTGRINAAKRHILKTGEVVRMSGGRVYRRVETRRVPMMSPEGRILWTVPVYTYVRDFEAEASAA